MTNHEVVSERVGAGKPSSAAGTSSSGRSAANSSKNAAIPRDDVANAHLDKPAERAAVYAHIAKYSHASWGRAFWELFHTLGFYALLWTMTEYPIVWVLTALMRVRIFIIFHDIAHGAFFPSPTVNKVASVLFATLDHMPAYWWDRGHNHHHRHSNNLKYPQLSQTCPLTMEQYEKLTPFQRRMYRFAFTPIWFLAVVPFATFGILFRFFAKWYEHILDIVYWYTVYQYGFFKFEFVTWVSSGILGFLLFHSQHTFPGAARYNPAEWSFFENGMSGSSYLQVPWFLKYFTANIEYHHIHHLSPLVPLYYLPECHNSSGKLFDRVPRVTLATAYRWLKPQVWDTKKNKFVEVH